MLSSKLVKPKDGLISLGLRIAIFRTREGNPIGDSSNDRINSRRAARNVPELGLILGRYA